MRNTTRGTKLSAILSPRSVKPPQFLTKDYVKPKPETFTQKIVTMFENSMPDRKDSYQLPSLTPRLTSQKMPSLSPPLFERITPVYQRNQSSTQLGGFDKQFLKKTKNNTRLLK